MTQIKAVGEFETVEAARTHLHKQERMISADVMRILMFNVGLYDWFMSQTEGLAKVAADNVRSGGEFNFMPSHALYLGPMMDGMAATYPEQAEKLTALKAACLSYAVKETQPYEHVSEYEWACARNIDLATKKKPISKIEGGFACIETTSDCEKHNPQIYQLVNGAHVRRASFLGVEKAGKYQVVVPSGVTLYVDDYYGVM